LVSPEDGPALVTEQGRPAHEDVMCSVRFYATEWHPFGSLFVLMTGSFLC
jgi:hypothetical protein